MMGYQLLKDYEHRASGSTKRYILRSRSWTELLFISLALANALWTLVLVTGVQTNLTRSSRLNEFGIDMSFSKQIQYKKPSPYFSPDEYGQDEVDAAWDAIHTTHGIIALDQDYAEQRGLPPSIYLPSNPRKQIYVMEAYHHLHCLVETRRAFYNLVKGNRTLNYRYGHYRHCWDAMLQSVLCTPSDNILYSFRHRPANVTQTLKCRNWDSIRQFASDHSSCDPNDTERINDSATEHMCPGDTDHIYLD